MSREVLISALKVNLESYKVQFAEAVELYQARLLLELKEAYDIVNASPLTIEILNHVRVIFAPPMDHENDYIEILEMLEMSVDETINLDAESFRAYIKNDWNWSASLNTSILSNKQYIAGKLY